MRVIGGEFRSRRLKTIPGLATRPTPARLRETLFDVLGGQVEGVTFLDAYAGTGAVGIEALSRGAARAIFLERNRSAINVIRENLAALNLQDRTTVVLGPVVKTLPGRNADIVFLDPPYEVEGEYATALEILGQASPPLVVVQHSARFELKSSYGQLACRRILKQGSNALSFFAQITSSTGAPA